MINIQYLISRIEPKPQFVPVTIEITCESQQELDAFRAILASQAIRRAASQAFGCNVDTFSRVTDSLDNRDYTRYNSASHRAFLGYAKENIERALSQ